MEPASICVSLTIHYETLGDAATPETLTNYLEALMSALDADPRVTSGVVNHTDGDDEATVGVCVIADDAAEALWIAQSIDRRTFDAGGW